MKKENLLFSILWPTAVFLVIASPLLKLGKKTAFFICVVAFVWIVGGGYIYLTQYRSYLNLAELNTDRRRGLEARKEELLDEYRYHPTSRDVLVELANITYQLDQLDETRKYARELERIDPNHPLTQELLQYVR